jgi:putative membrane protein
VTRSVRLAWLELKRFRTPLQMAGLAFLLCVPLLYGAIYLWSNWNPYGRLDQVPVAVVNSDRPVTTGGQRVDAGGQFVTELRRNPLLGWRFVSPSEASRGLREGRYYAIITVPADFSAKLSSGASGTPRRAAMSIRLDDANNYLVGIMAETVQSELERQIAAAADTAYFQTVFARLGGLKRGLGSAADGAGTLGSGLSTAKAGSASLASGLAQLAAGTGRLAPGAAAVAAGVNQVTALEAPLTLRLASALPGLAQRSAAATSAATSLSGSVAGFTQTVTAAAGRLLAWLESLPRQDPGLAHDAVYQAFVQQAFVQQARAGGLSRAGLPGAGLSGGLAALAEARPEIKALPGYPGAAIAAHLADGAFSWLLTQLAVHDPSVSRDPLYGLLLALARQIGAQVHQVSALAASVYGYVSSVNATVRTLQGQVPAAQARLRQAASQLDQLDSGAAALASGVRAAASGTNAALAGANQLDAGNAQLLSGANDLASGLRSAASQVPAMSAAAAQILASPVNVTTSNAHPARVYGRGLAPFFFAIALWVFGIVAFLLLRPVSGRLLASTAGSGLVTLAAWLPVVATGTVAALILYTVVDLCLGLDPVNAAGTVALMVLGVASFSAVVHVFRLAFGAVGDAIALVLLMLQLVSCGGLYPVQTLPLPFRALNHVVPMTYLVRALRVTISGGNSTIMWHAVLVLAGFGVVSLVLLWLVVGRQRVWTMARLKPGLEL